VKAALAAATVCASAAVLVASGVVVLRDRGSDDGRAATHLAAARPEQPALVSLPPPDRLVVRRHPAAPGLPTVDLVATATGTTVRTLHAPAPEWAEAEVLRASTDAVYLVRLTRPGVVLDVQQISLEGGSERTVGPDETNGRAGLSPTPDGRAILTGGAHGGYALVDVASGASRRLPEFAAGDQRAVGLSWLPDGRTLVALTANPLTMCGRFPGTQSSTRCPSVTHLPKRAWSLDTTAAEPEWMQLADAPSWDDLTTVLGPGRLPGTVVATSAHRGAAGDDVLTVDETGHAVDRVSLGGFSAVAVDRTGTNLVVQRQNELAWLSLADPAPHALGPAVVTATWW
jgi:hypothetical protein